jgi:YD repeat-containing protein
MTLHTYKFDNAGRVIHDKTDDLEWFYKYDDDDNLIAYLCKDISISVIKNDINLERILKKYVNSDNRNDFKIFIKEVNRWILDSLDLDTILDMINEKGINSLRKVDKTFLKKV